MFNSMSFKIISIQNIYKFYDSLRKLSDLPILKKKQHNRQHFYPTNCYLHFSQVKTNTDTAVGVKTLSFDIKLLCTFNGMFQLLR
jgi:hypothetical protein